jgi:hypothetical protein
MTRNYVFLLSPDLGIVWNLWRWTKFHSTNIHNKAQVFLGVTPCPLSGSCRHFRAAECLHLQSQAVQVMSCCRIKKLCIFYVLTAIRNKVQVFWDVAPCQAVPKLGLLDVLSGGNTLPPSDGKTTNLAIFVHNWHRFHNKSLSQSRFSACTIARTLICEFVSDSSLIMWPTTFFTLLSNTCKFINKILFKKFPKNAISSQIFELYYHKIYFPECSGSKQPSSDRFIYKGILVFDT